MQYLMSITVMAITSIQSRSMPKILYIASERQQQIIDELQLSKLLKAHSGLRKILATKSPLKMMKNTFYFTSKALVVLKIFKVLS